MTSIAIKRSKQLIRPILLSLRSLARIDKSTVLKFSTIFAVAFVLNLLIFFIIQLMVTGKASQAGLKNIDLLVNSIRYQQDVTPPPPEQETEPLEELLPEEELPKPNMPRPDIAPPSSLTPSASSVPMPDMSFTTDGLPMLDKILRFSTGRIKSPAFKTNLVPTVKIPPIYPQRALSMGIEGIVTVEFTIGIDGSVKNPVIIKSRPPKIFDDAVLQAIKKWKYDPEMEGGKLVERRARQDVSFNLSD